MLHSDVLVKKMSRRVALLSIAGTAGLVVAGCGSTVAGASGNDTSVAASTPTATTAAATPTPAPSPASTPTSVSTAEPGTTLFTYKGHTSTVETVTWSPDSQMVASIEQTGSLHVWEATTGKLKFVCHAIPGNKALSWSMNGKYIAAATGAGVSVWDASNGSLITNYNVGAITLAFSRIASVSQPVLLIKPFRSGRLPLVLTFLLTMATTQQMACLCIPSPGRQIANKLCRPQIL